MSLHISNPKIKIYHCNGMRTTKESALEDCKLLQKYMGAKVKLYHNGTTPEEKFSSLALSGGVGALCLAGAARAYKKESQVACGVLSALGAYFSANAASTYLEIQCLKKESGLKLAKKIKRKLAKDPSLRIGLSCHSQGADIIIEALKQLKDYKHRIKVISFGGKSLVSSDLAAEVVNFDHIKDIVARTAKSFDLFPGPHIRVMANSSSCETPLCHGMIDYVKIEGMEPTLAAFGKVGPFITNAAFYA